MPFDWSGAVVSDLRALWAEGHSTAEIGRRLGVSKNAVIGKAHRLELPNRPSPLVPGSGSRSSPKRVGSGNSGTRPMNIRAPKRTLPAVGSAETARRIAVMLVGSGPPATPEPYLDPRRVPEPVPVAPEPSPAPSEHNDEALPPATPVEASRPVLVRDRAARRCEFLRGKSKPWVRCEGVIERLGQLESWCEECRKVVFEKRPARHNNDEDTASIGLWRKLGSAA